MKKPTLPTVVLFNATIALVLLIIQTVLSFIGGYTAYKDDSWQEFEYCKAEVSLEDGLTRQLLCQNSSEEEFVEVETFRRKL